MITKEHEYILQDATDDLRKAVGTAAPGNRAVHYTVAIHRSPDSHTSLEFIRMTMRKRTADEFQLAQENILNSIGQLFVHKGTSTSRFQVDNRNVVAKAPLRTRFEQ